MPLSTIVECLRPARSDISNLVGTRGMLQLRGDLVPIVHLGDLLDVGSRTGRVGGERRHHHRRGRWHALRPRRRRALRPPAGRDQEHRGELRLRPGYCRRDDSRQWPGRVHPRCREAVRSCGQVVRESCSGNEFRFGGEGHNPLTHWKACATRARPLIRSNENAKRSGTQGSRGRRSEQRAANDPHDPGRDRHPAYPRGGERRIRRWRRRRCSRST